MVNKNIQAVENGLRTAVSIHGLPQKTYNIMDRMKYFHVPGVSISVINNGDIEWSRSYGVLEMNGDQAVGSGTLFQAASISKPISAMVVLKLAEQGILDLDRDVNDFLSSWKITDNEYTKKNKVTLRSILSHTAGLTVHGFQGYGFNAEVPSLLQILNGEPPANSESIRVDVRPGSMFRYSGGGYTVIQQVIEDIADKTFDEVLRAQVLDILNMNSSTFAQPLPVQLRGNAATGHVGTGIPVQGKWHIYPEKAAAGLWTTPTDLTNFVIEVMKSCDNRSNKIISKGMLDNMLMEIQENYGLGLMVKKLGNNIIRFSHSGGNEGFRCFLVGYTGNEKGAVVMTNSNNGDFVMMEIVRSISNVYEWADFLPTEKQVNHHVSPGIYSKFAGKYQHPDYPEFFVQIEKDGNQLLLELIQGGTHWRLYPESETKYFFVEGDVSIEFQKNDYGIFDTLILFSMRLNKVA